MPPWSDVRTLAQSLATGDDFVTFLDVLPLQRLAQSLVHMPRPTLEAIAELHDGAHVTLGAKDVLMDLLRNYYSRAGLERQLGQKLLTLKEHNKTIRLPLGQYSTLMLPRDRCHFWQLHTLPLGASSGHVELEEVEGSKVHEQRVLLHATTAGLVELTAHLQEHAMPSRCALSHATDHSTSRTRRKKMVHFRLAVVVEEADAEP